MNKNLVYLIFVIGLFACCFQTRDIPVKELYRGDIRLMFYNVENLFDTTDSPNTSDTEFTPESDKRWSSYRYYKKLQNIFQVIAGVGGETAPDIVGFAEVENRQVLEDLIHRTPLDRYPFGIVHKESPDFRGIDVALIYRTDKLQLIDSNWYPILFPAQNYASRDILHAIFIVGAADTLHVFVNHWPSRRGGEKASAPKRVYAARQLKKVSDSLLQANSNAKIIITGDFNDEPYNTSLSEGLWAHTNITNITDTALYNLSAVLKDSCKCGTYRYRGQWNMLDQFVVSGSLLKKVGLRTTTGHTGVFKNSFLLQEDTRYGGYYPFRTYLGPRYLGGYSDHLPVYLDLFY